MERLAIVENKMRDMFYDKYGDILNKDVKKSNLKEKKFKTKKVMEENIDKSKKKIDKMIVQSRKERVAAGKSKKVYNERKKDKYIYLMKDVDSGKTIRGFNELKDIGEHFGNKSVQYNVKIQ